MNLTLTSWQISEVKQKISEAKAGLAVERQKLIHSGKVLKDEQSVSDLGLAESDFIVCMISKEIAKKPVAEPVPAAVPKPAPAPAPVPAVAPVQQSPVIPSPQPAVAQSSPASNPTIDNDSLQALVNMGFPESECRAALTAAMGNPDLAYEFLLTGIPDARSQFQQSPPVATATGSNVTIDSLRSHPQFNTLKRLVQENPAAISQVLDIIGQQNPALLAAIHANTDAFLRMMNEPIVEQPAGAVQPPPVAPLGGPQTDPMQMIQFLNSLPPEQRSEFAQSLGMSAEQLQGVMSMMSSIPPNELQNMLRRNGGGNFGGADPPGVIRLTQEEMAAVNRLMALGFSQQQAAQAYLACDKNEDLAANLLLEGGWAEEEQDFGDGHEDEYH